MSGATADSSSLTAEQLTALGANYSGVSFGSAAGALPACTSHEDCEPGNYCAWDNTCHPERHAPKQALVFNVVEKDLASGAILSGDAQFGDDTDNSTTSSDAAEAAGPSGPYGAGEPKFTAVAGVVGGSQRLLDLGEEFLTSIRLKKVNGTCQIWANDTTLDLCGNYANTYTGSIEEIDVALQQSVIGRLSACSIGAVVGLQIWGDVVNADGSTTYMPAADKDEFPVCNEMENTIGNRWTSSMLCASGYVGTGLVVHSNDVGPEEVITGLQLICRRIAVRN
jgi:hypothetical protein